jgi:heme/copper-type cytochrome/quinol oxidase subunit 3
VKNVALYNTSLKCLYFIQIEKFEFVHRLHTNMQLPKFSVICFFSLDIGNENHIGVLVITTIVLNATIFPKCYIKRYSVKYDSVMMASCCWHNVCLIVKKMKLRIKNKKPTCICINVNLRHISAGVDLLT